ncbi:Nitrogen assimilation regulatory protein [compost metagenome]
MMQQVADTDASVLILGESGTGKEVVARNLHYHSSRREFPFVPISCTAIAPELLESELFGYEKGGFTGAISSHKGRLELAAGGTLYIDEVADLPAELQGRLLRVLQEGRFKRFGSDEEQLIDVRIIAASRHDLEARVAAGTFRDDLYYRLNQFSIELPPLRERVEDIPLLLNELIARMEHEKRGSIRFSSAALMSLCRHDWRGNVRELANLVERLAIMHPYGVMGVAELPKKFRHLDGESAQEVDGVRRELDSQVMPVGALPGLDAPALLPVGGLDLKDYLGNLERSLIQQALDDAGGVVARAAERLRLRRTTLVEKMRKYGMSRRDDEEGEL